jgi:DNA-binding MurR/RpiR family transcriptional regulator
MVEGSGMHFTNVRERIRKHYETLSKNNLAIADWMMENFEAVPFMSVQELAERIGLSVASIVRFSQRIGYSGFSDLKDAISEGVVDQLNAVRIPKLDELGHEGENILVRVANQDIGNIRDTLTEIDADSFDLAVTRILKARRIYTIGLGLSYILARLMSYQLRQTGQNARVFRHDESTFNEETLFLEPDDLVVAFSFPPYSRETIDLCERLAKLGMATLLVTDRRTAPGAMHARQVLVVHSENMLYTNSVSAISVLLNAISTECARRNPERAREIITQVNRLAEESHEFKK